MSAGKWATDTNYSDEHGWGVTLTDNSFGEIQTYPGLKSVAEAKGFILGWNQCRNAIASAMLIKAVTKKK